MNQKIASKANNLEMEWKGCIRLMWCANITKTSQNEQQNPKTPTKINYIENFMSVLKNKT